MLYLSDTWKRLRGVFSTEAIETTTESTKAVLELGKTLKEQGTSLEVLKPLVEKSSSLLDILSAPEAQLLGAGLPFVPIIITLFKLYREKTRQELALEECVAIVAQAAYLESFKEVISEQQDILTRWKDKSNTESIKKELKKLDNFKLDLVDAQRVLTSFPDSKLAQELNKVFSEALQQAGLPANEADDFTAFVARNSHRYFFRALMEARDSVKVLVELYRNGGTEGLKKYVSLQCYLETQIADQPQEKVFNEKFSFADIYVKPKVRKVDSNGYVDERVQPFDLEVWATKLLLDKDPNKKSKVIFIQGGPGRGKSIFCRMFADLVRRDIYHRWIPVLICLRDIDEFQPSLEETLRSRIKYDFAQIDEGWLTDANTKFLFILDGFDELRIERSNNQSIDRFIRQVGTFQFDYKGKHRVIITGRAMALHGIDRLPPNLERVEIAEMDSELQSQWFDKWQNLFSTDKTTEFRHFLQNDINCPASVQELAKEPLLLYMLAAIHRDADDNDNAFKLSKFRQATGTEAKILVYKEALNWVLTKQRFDERHPDLNLEITRQKPEALKRILAEAAVCVVQSGGESASIQMVKARLDVDSEAKDLIAKAEEELGNEALKTALCAFYLKSNICGGVEFFHKSFREFLCAERLKQSLEEWTEPGIRGKNFYIDDKKLHEQIYDLLGYGGLTQEIVEYLIGLLDDQKNEFRPVQLFNRLQYFYNLWCQGYFIDFDEETLPQDKARQLQKYGIKLGQRQVDIYTGLNVMILLLELHRYAQHQDELKQEIHFYPSGQANTEFSQLDKLLCIINYSNSMNLENFNEVIGQFLISADLGSADLGGADLGCADLGGANLRGANLQGANLDGANLDGADLRGANLRSANIRGANLQGANLRSANLDSAYLRGADLQGADLVEAKKLTQEQINKAFTNGNTKLPDYLQLSKSSQPDPPNP